MSILTRLSRAAVAFLVFGIFAAMLPSNGSALADTSNCVPLSSGSSGNNNMPTEGQIFVGVVGVGAIYALVVAPSRRHHDNDTNTSSAGVKQVASNYSGIQGYLYSSR